MTARSTSAAGERPALVLVEPNLKMPYGHWCEHVPQLADAAKRRGLRLVIAAPDGVDPATQGRLDSAGAEVLSPVRPGLGPSGASMAAARIAHAVYVKAHAWRPRSPVPYQFLLISRCLTEAAALRHARARTGVAAAVILSAGESLAGAVSALSGVPHVRIVHEVYSWDSPFFRFVEWLCRASRRQVVAVCNTASVKCKLTRRYPDLAATVATFAPRNPAAYVPDGERAVARSLLALPRDGVIGCFIGGWWRTKDWKTVLAALELSQSPVRLLIAGWPVDLAILGDARRTADGRVHVLAKSLTSVELRAVYAACDFTLVSRFAGDETESGLVMDAVNYGLPLVLSDHDQNLNRVLAGADWVRFYSASDPASLAHVLDGTLDKPIPRPSRAGVNALGMRTVDDVLSMLYDLASNIPGGHNGKI
ncbi:MAG TPA: hypothetical protein VN714_00960 [Trebonia sp.]|nr:hypothetical protein [Trebonia sp.]